MKKIFLIIFIFFLNFSSIFAYEIGREIFRGKKEDTISKIDFSGKNFELLKSKTYFSENEEKNYDIFPEILKNISKEKASKFIENDKLQIYGQFGFCGPIDFEKKDETCIFEKNFTFKLNKNISEIYKVSSEKDENITMEYYPISPDYFVYYRYYSKNTPFLTIFTNNLDIFDPKIYIYQKNIGFNIYKNNFEKKYKLVKMSYGNYIYIPYYSISLDLKKGENFFEFNYKKN